MGSIAGIFDGAKQKIRQGKANIRQAVSGSDGREVGIFDHELFQREDSVYGDEWGSERNNLGFEALGYSFTGGINSTVGLENANLGIDLNHKEYLVQAEANLGAGPVGAGVNGMVGNEGHATGNVVWDFSERQAGLELGGGGTLGAQGEITTSLNLGVADGSVGATGIAGLSADVDFDLGFEDGKLNIGGKGKLALGLGGGFNGDLSLDLGAIGEHGKSAAGWGIDRAEDIGGKAKDFGGWVNPFD